MDLDIVRIIISSNVSVFKLFPLFFIKFSDCMSNM